MASIAIVKRKGFDSSSVVAKRPKILLDNPANERFETDFKSKGICAPREVNFEFFDKEPELNVFQLFSQMEESGEIVGQSMIRRKKVELTAENIRSWIGVKKGDFKRYSSREPIFMESYSIEKAAKKLGGSSNGEVTLGQGVVFVGEDWVGANVQGNYYNRLIQNMSFKKVGGKWIKLGKAKAEPREGSDKKKMNLKHGRRPPKSTKGSVSKNNEEKEESVDSDATMYSESLVHQSDEQQDVSSHLAPENEPKHEPEPPKSKHSPKANPSSSEPQPQPSMTPLTENREQLRNLTSQMTSAREEIYELKMIIIEMRAQQKEENMNKPTPSAIIPDQPPSA
ncbi:uncharacterized protein G2W53_029130 [Senna tora]|uniref:Uncharacterized protein n=1 Tax=Senna tora TaxID=362788 RepID=A0A834T6M1_9FABA|nr:uncharacterized protein G2W53_029130 [Senna tora]